MLILRIDLFHTRPVISPLLSQSLPNVPNDTIMTLSVQNPLVMNVGQNATLDVTVKVPPVSVSRFLFDAEVPHDGTSACMTIRDIRVVGW